MALVAGQRSTLNPNAPLFIPAVYRQVEDFSPEWWDLVKTSTWFRDYWLSEHSEGSFDGDCDDDDDFVYLEDQLEELIKLTEDEEKKKPLDGNGVKLDLQGIVKELMIPKSGKERRLKSLAKAAKYQVKAAYCESPKSAPRRIHQIHQPR